MKKCNLCKEASNFNYGFKGENADLTKLLIVLHRPDIRITEYFGGSLDALMHSATGRILDKILEQAGLDLPDVYITNFFKCLLLQDHRPSPEQYRNCLSIFKQQVEEFEPKAIVIFGARPYKYIFPEERKKHKITELKTVLFYNETPCLVSIHPSQIWKKLNSDLKKPHIKRIAEFIKEYTG